jgi:hypothetical protein
MTRKSPTVVSNTGLDNVSLMTTRSSTCGGGGKRSSIRDALKADGCTETVIEKGMYHLRYILKVQTRSAKLVTFKFRAQRPMDWRVALRKKKRHFPTIIATFL